MASPRQNAFKEIFGESLLKHGFFYKDRAYYKVDIREGFYISLALLRGDIPVELEARSFSEKVTLEELKDHRGYQILNRSSNTHPWRWRKDENGQTVRDQRAEVAHVFEEFEEKFAPIVYEIKDEASLYDGLGKIEIHIPVHIRRNCIWTMLSLGRYDEAIHSLYDRRSHHTDQLNRVLRAIQSGDKYELRVFGAVENTEYRVAAMKKSVADVQAYIEELESKTPEEIAQMVAERKADALNTILAYFDKGARKHLIGWEG